MTEDVHRDSRLNESHQLLTDGGSHRPSTSTPTAETSYPASFGASEPEFPASFGASVQAERSTTMESSDTDTEDPTFRMQNTVTYDGFNWVLGVNLEFVTNDGTTVYQLYTNEVCLAKRNADYDHGTTVFPGSGSQHDPSKSELVDIVNMDTTSSEPDNVSRGDTPVTGVSETFTPESAPEENTTVVREDIPENMDRPNLSTDDEEPGEPVVTISNRRNSSIVPSVVSKITRGVPGTFLEARLANQNQPERGLSKTKGIRDVTRRFLSEKNTTWIGEGSVLLVAMLAWGLLTGIAGVRFGVGSNSFSAVAVASLTGMAASVTAYTIDRLGNRITTVAFAYPAAVTALFLPPVVASMTFPTISTSVLITERSHALAVWFLNDVAPPGLSAYLQVNYEFDAMAQLLMWSVISIQLGWILGLTITGIEEIREKLPDSRNNAAADEEN